MNVLNIYHINTKQIDTDKIKKIICLLLSLLINYNNLCI